MRRNGVTSAIDLALVSERCSYVWQRAPDTAGSDHYPITLAPTSPSRGVTRVCVVVRWSKYRDLCREWSHDTDFFGHVAECARRASTRAVVPAGSPCPDIKLLNLRAARRRAQRRAVRSGIASDWTVYNRLDAVCRRHAKRLRRRSWARLCSSLADPRNQHRGWRVMRALVNPKSPRWPVLAIAVARGITEMALAELLADSFAAIAVSTSPGVPAVALRALYTAVFVRGEDRAHTARVIDSLCGDDFTFHEQQRVLCRRRRRSAPGADGVTHQMLRNLDDDHRRHLLDAYNTVFREAACRTLGAVLSLYQY